MKLKIYNQLKRVIDFILTAPAFIVLSPLFFIIGVLIFFTMGFPILFKQRRPGLNGRPFYMYKFRTMNDKKDDKGNYLSDADRMTSLGYFLRSTSLDELPELFNVLKGDMSLVGPRPLLMRYMDRYTPEQARRHDVKPGLSGWAQVNGRNTLSWEDKFNLDIWYVDHKSIILDIQIILKTILKVVRRSDISADGHATMPEFYGTKEV